jgi:ATP-dependent Clp protease ATP-binding subunit ClpB
VRTIVDIRLRELQQRLDDNGRRIRLIVDDPAKDWLAVSFFTPSPLSIRVLLLDSDGSVSFL